MSICRSSGDNWRREDDLRGVTGVVSDDTSGDSASSGWLFLMWRLDGVPKSALRGLASKFPHSFSCIQLYSTKCKSVYFRRYDFYRYAINMVFWFTSSWCVMMFLLRNRAWSKRGGIFCEIFYFSNFGGKGVPLSILYDIYVGINLTESRRWDSYMSQASGLLIEETGSSHQG